VALHQALVDEDPGEGDDQGEDDEQVAGEGGRLDRGLAGGGAVSAEGDERGAEGGDGESEPADPVHSLVGEESCADARMTGMVPTISEAWETVVRRGRRTG